MNTYEQVKDILEGYGFKEIKEKEFSKIYTHKRYYWSGSLIDEVEVTIYTSDIGEYEGDDISILNDSLEYDEIPAMIQALDEANDDLTSIINEVNEIFDMEEK